MRRWRVRSLLPPNARPQNRHTNGRSPVCFRTCSFKFSLDRTHLPQNGQANRLSLSLCLSSFCMKFSMPECELELSCLLLSARDSFSELSAMELMLANETGIRLFLSEVVSSSRLVSLSAPEVRHSVESSTVTTESVGPLESTVLSCSASRITSADVLAVSFLFFFFIDKSISPHWPIRASLVLET